jgi:serine protease Do
MMTANKTKVRFRENPEAEEALDMTRDQRSNVRWTIHRAMIPLGAFLIGLALAVQPALVQAQDHGVESLRQSGEAFATIAKEVSPAVVFIKVEKTVEEQGLPFAWPQSNQQNDQDFPQDFLHQFFNFPFRDNSPRKEHVVGQGSGFIVSNDGYIVTNNHVVGDADRVTVTLQDGREFTAKTVGTDPHSDIAVIKIDGDHLPDLKMGDSDKLDVGEWVLAVGNPFGLSHTITAGIVSAKGRSSVGITDYEDFIQTDAAINPGNSGGPLVDLDGDVVGMNTAIFSQSGGYMGIGFAIPANMVRSISDQIIEHGSVTRGYLGVTIQDLTPELAKSFGIHDEKGILVAQVVDDTPASKAGLKQGDLIVALNGGPTGKMGEFRNRIALTAPGTKDTLTILRDGKREDVDVTIGTLPQNAGSEKTTPATTQQIGLTVQNLTPDLAARLNYEGETGVVVSQVEHGSVAELAGIRAGSLIQEVNRTEVANVKQFQQAVDKTPKGQPILLLVKEGQYSRFVALQP